MAEKRDFIMARLAAARNLTQTMLDGIDGMVEQCMDGDEDPEGDVRREALDIILDTAGDVSRTIEKVQEVFDGLSAEEMGESEDYGDEDTEGEEG